MTGKSKKKKRTPLARAIRRVPYALLFILLVLLLALVGVNQYLSSNQEKLFENIPFLNHASVSFDKINISVFRDFPKASIVIKGVKIADSLSKEIGYPLASFNEIRAGLSIRDWSNRRLEIRSIHIEDGEFNIYKKADGYSNLSSVFKRNSKSKNTPELGDQEEKSSLLNINDDTIEIHLEDITFNLVDSVKTTNIRTEIEALIADLTFANEEVSASVAMDVAVEGLAFKAKNGPFLSKSRVRGNFKAEIKDNLITFNPFDLTVNEQEFLFSGQVALDKSRPTKLVLVNESTVFEKVVPLLASNLQKAVQPYQVEEPFYTETKLVLEPGKPVLVDIDFDLPKNDLNIKNMAFDEAVAKGRFVNRLYDDERRADEAKGSLRVLLQTVNTKFDAFDIQAENVEIIAIPKMKTRLKADAIVTGKAKGIGDLLQNDNFFFQEGDFSLKANIDGTLDNVTNILKKSAAELHLKNTRVLYKPANAIFPFEELSLTKKSGAVNFEILGSTKVKGHDYRLTGGVRNLSALLVDRKGQYVSSNAQFRATKIGWQDFIDLFGDEGDKKERGKHNERRKKKNMKRTLRGIDQKFGPRLSIALDTVEYLKNLPIQNFKTGAHFENGDTVILEKTSFDLAQGHVTLSSRLDLSDPEKTPFAFDLQVRNINLQQLLPSVNYFNVKLLEAMPSHSEDLNIDIKFSGIVDDVEGLLPNNAKGEISFKSDKKLLYNGKIAFAPADLGQDGEQATRTTIDLEGDPHLFNDFFKNDNFLFTEKGKFRVRFDYTGDATSVEHLLNKSKATFTIEDGEVAYAAADILFPLTKVTMNANGNRADFDITMHSDSLNRTLNLSGEIDNLTEMVLGNTGKQLHTTLDIYSTKLNLAHVKNMLPPAEKSDREKSGLKIENKIKTLIKGILNRFNPDLHVVVDSFVVADNLEFRNLKTGIVMKDATTLVLDKTGFDLDDGRMQLNAEFDLGSMNEAPFKANLSTEDLNLSRLLEGLNYLGSTSLRNAEKLEGRLNLDFDIESSMADFKLIPERTMAKIDFNLYDLEVHGLDIVDQIAAKLMAKKRFHDMLFAPIKNTLTVKGSEVRIPQMEIQSNALNLFVEGVYDPDRKTDVWLSVPLNNLTKKTEKTAPELSGYADTKSKVYLELTNGDDGKTAVKFHFGKKKFYEERGIPEQYKADKKKYRKIRRGGKDRAE